VARSERPPLHDEIVTAAYRAWDEVHAAIGAKMWSPDAAPAAAKTAASGVDLEGEVKVLA
jgi:hypothetical protein